MKKIKELIGIHNTVVAILVIATVLFILSSCVILSIDVIKNGANL